MYFYLLKERIWRYIFCDFQNIQIIFFKRWRSSRLKRWGRQCVNNHRPQKGSEHSWTLQGAKTIGQHSKTMNKLPPSKIMQQSSPEIKRTWWIIGTIFSGILVSILKYFYTIQYYFYSKITLLAFIEIKWLISVN